MNKYSFGFKFLDLKKLVYQYKDKKESEIQTLVNEHENLKKEINKRCEKLNWILSTENVILNKQSFFKAIKKSISKRKNNNLIKHLY